MNTKEKTITITLTEMFLVVLIAVVIGSAFTAWAVVHMHQQWIEQKVKAIFDLEGGGS